MDQDGAEQVWEKGQEEQKKHQPTSTKKKKKKRKKKKPKPSNEMVVDDLEASGASKIRSGPPAGGEDSNRQAVVVQHMDEDEVPVSSMSANQSQAHTWMGGKKSSEGGKRKAELASDEGISRKRPAAMSDEAIEEALVRRAKATLGAPVGVPDSLWRGVASVAAMTNSVQTGDDAALDRLAQAVLSGVRKSISKSTAVGSIAPPKVCETAASTLGKNAEKRSVFDQTILPPELLFGPFVLVPSYLSFVKSMNPTHKLKRVTENILEQEITQWCPKEATTTVKEAPRSVQLSRILLYELAVDAISVVHQTPILPNEKKSDQYVDIAMFCETSGQVAVALEYKPGNNFDQFQSQASCYGTDNMTISKRSVVVVQVHGQNLTDLSIRAFGILPLHEKYRKTLLFEGKGRAALKMLVTGIKGYVKCFKQEIMGEWMSTVLSNVTALHAEGGKQYVVKAYDYRTRHVLPQDRRQANIELVREFVDVDAQLTRPEKDLSIVTSKFHERDDEGAIRWFDPVPACNLGLLLQNLGHMDRWSGSWILVRGESDGGCFRVSFAGGACLVLLSEQGDASAIFASVPLRLSGTHLT